MLIIGLTGGIGSGKSTTSNAFEQLGIPIIDADLIAHKIILEPQVLSKITAHFGTDTLHKDNKLNRTKLRTLIFKDLNKKKWLESLLHPLIRKSITKALAEASGPYVILSAPLLLETNLDQLTHRVLVLDIPETLQIERTCHRDGCNPSLVQSIIKQQISRQQRLAKADDILYNHLDVPHLIEQVQQLHSQYLASTNKDHS